MKKVKKTIRVIGFVFLLLLAMSGIGIPIPLFLKDRFAIKENHKEQIDEKEEDNEELDWN